MAEEKPEVQIGVLHEQNQVAVVTFLQTDLDLAFEFLAMAQNQIDNPDRLRSLVEKARSALQMIRHLSGRIDDRSVWEQIHSRADELESALQEFSNG